MIVLGLDTATPSASAALVEDGELVAEEIYHKSAKPGQSSAVRAPGNHSEIVLPLIQSVLDKRKISLAALQGLAVSIGPGSFTGLRIALATVKGLAYEWGLPVVGVSTLKANAARLMAYEGFICSLLDARKREVYAGIYCREGQSLIPVCAEQVCAIETVIEAMRTAGATDAVLVGDGATTYEALFRAALGPSLRIASGHQLSSIAAQVAKIPWRRLSDRAGDDLASLEPIYLRPPEAQRRQALRV